MPTFLSITFQGLIAELAPLVLALAFVSGLIRYRKLEANLRYLVALLAFGGTFELIETILWLKHQPNLFLIPVFVAGEVWLLALLYDRTLQWPAFSRVRPWLAGAFVAYCVLDSVVFPEAARFKPVLLLVESLLVLSLVALFFRKLLNELRVTNLGQEPMFWVSTGLVINHVGSIQILLFSNFLLSNYSKQLNLDIWAIHALLLVILYSCYCVALWIRPQN